MQISIDPIIASRDIILHLGAMRIAVEVKDSPAGLVESLKNEAWERAKEMMGQAASGDPIIAGTRRAFKSCGKDPSRYRPSSEALLRRAMSGQDLHFVNNVVDSGNLVSLATGLSVGCYDIDKLDGDIRLSIAGADEKYDGIGRGAINLEGLPTLYDDKGPFGTPYSDSKRSMVTTQTTDFLFVLFGFNVEVDVVEAASDSTDLIFSSFCLPDKTVE